MVAITWVSDAQIGCVVIVMHLDMIERIAGEKHIKDSAIYAIWKAMQKGYVFVLLIF